MIKRYDRKTAKAPWTIEKMQEYGDFCGFNRLFSLMDAVKIGLRGPVDEILIHNEKERDEARAIIATTFSTGCRINEVLGQVSEDEYKKYLSTSSKSVKFLEGTPGLYTSDFEVISADEVQVSIHLSKKYRKIGRKTKYKATDETFLRWDSKEDAEISSHPYESYEGYVTKRESKVRKVGIPFKEPLVKPMMDWVGKKKEESEAVDVLGAKLFSTKYNRLYRTITTAGNIIGEEFPPHRLRAEKATLLATRYRMPEWWINKWFSWVDSAKDYTVLKRVTEEEMIIRANRLFK